MPDQNAPSALANTVQLPANIEAEQFVLGSVLLDNRLLETVSAKLERDDFAIRKHQLIHQAMLRLHQAGQPIECLTLGDALQQEQHLESVGGIAYLASLTGGLPQLQNIDSYIEIVRSKALLRQAMQVATATLASCQQHAGSPADLLDQFAISATELADRAAPSGTAPTRGIVLHPASHWDAADLPKPILRKSSNGAEGSGAVLCAGEIAILSGAGGRGKSTLALQLALAAAAGHGSNEYRYAAGLEIASGPAVYASYEDRGAVIRHRIRAVSAKDDPQVCKRVFVAEMAGRPLFGPPMDSGLYAARPERQYPAWRQFWSQVEDVSPSIVLIDPVGAAYAAESARVESVRLFMDALRSEAARLQCGVLLIAHSTKAERSRARAEGGDPDAGAVAGSAAWHDAARGVLTLERDRSSKTCILHCVKANYGALWSPVTLRRTGAGQFHEAEQTLADTPSGPRESRQYA